MSNSKVVLAVIDGLAPATLERALEAGRLPALASLRDHGDYTRAVTTFPSVTPVCLTTIATGVHPDRHHVPHLVWFHRRERRLVEYGSSLAAVRAVGARRSMRDSIVEMAHRHTNPEATTVFEAVADAGLVSAAVNFTAYRGRTRHEIRLPAAARRNRWYEAVYGPQRFFFFNLYESDETGAGLAVRSRTAGSVDAYAAAVGRWLVTRDGFDFLVYYLPDFDYAAHAAGPDAALAALERADRCLAELMTAAGGLDAFLDRYAIVVCADHGQTRVEHEAVLQEPYADLAVYSGRRDGDPDGFDVAVAASNRAGMVFRLPGSRLDDRALAERLDGVSWADVVLFREEGFAVARRDGEELRFARAAEGWLTDGDTDILDSERYPNGLERAWAALACPRAGEVIVSPAEGYEFRDLGGRNHLGGGSHGSLLAGDSVVPMLAAGFGASPFPDDPQTTDLAPLVLAELGVDPPATMRWLAPAGA
jgi:predicted AlkP superfamily pyrophosphatase or phosphodiesterase